MIFTATDEEYDST